MLIIHTIHYTVDTYTFSEKEETNRRSTHDTITFLYFHG